MYKNIKLNAIQNCLCKYKLLCENRLGTAHREEPIKEPILFLSKKQKLNLIIHSFKPLVNVTLFKCSSKLILMNSVLPLQPLP